MPMILAELKALAETATPGPWKTTRDYNEMGVCLLDGSPVADCFSANDAADAAFVAAANPRVVLAMIETIQAIDEYIQPERYGYAYENWKNMITARAALDAALKEPSDV